ncbi:MAG TPA: HU family DNA-binding protein [Fodinibius sp.]|nr:HU family DNA-binding protein [Fodinibius sp.]
MDEQFLEALTAIIREQISRKNKVHIDGMGAFRLEHQKQFQKQYDNGRVVMMPPKDLVRFTPDN